MTTGLLHLHSLLRWFALLAIVVAIIRNFNRFRGNKPFAVADNRWSLLTLIGFHLQLVLGLVLYFSQGWYQHLGEMSNKLIRFFTLEHTLGMLVAIILVTIGRSKMKKMATDREKHKKQFWYFLVALLLVLAMIPWPFREIIGDGRGWFPGM